MGDRLERPDRPSELHPVTRVRNRHLQRPFRGSHRVRELRHCGSVERPSERIVDALAFLATERFGRGIAKLDRKERLDAQVAVALDRDRRRVRFHEIETVGGAHDHDVRDAGPRHRDLLAAQSHAADESGGTPLVAMARFQDRHRADRVTGSEYGKPARLLGVGAEPCDRQRRQRRRRHERRRHGTAPEHLAQHRELEDARSPTRRPPRASQAPTSPTRGSRPRGRRRIPPGPARCRARLLDGARPQHEVTTGRSKHPLFVRQGEVHDQLGRGRPRPRWATTFFCTSSVPAAMVVGMLRSQ